MTLSNTFQIHNYMVHSGLILHIGGGRGDKTADHKHKKMSKAAVEEKGKCQPWPLSEGFQTHCFLLSGGWLFASTPLATQNTCHIIPMQSLQAFLSDSSTLKSGSHFSRLQCKPNEQMFKKMLSFETFFSRGTLRQQSDGLVSSSEFEHIT